MSNPRIVMSNNTVVNCGSVASVDGYDLLIDRLDARGVRGDAIVSSNGDVTISNSSFKDVAGSIVNSATQRPDASQALRMIAEADLPIDCKRFVFEALEDLEGRSPQEKVSRLRDLENRLGSYSSIISVPLAIILSLFQR